MEKMTETWKKRRKYEKNDRNMKKMTETWKK